jgi:hypothetical protein
MLYVILHSNKSKKKEIVFNSRAIPPSHKKTRKKGRKLRKRDEREREGIISCSHNISSLGLLLVSLPDLLILLELFSYEIYCCCYRVQF